MLLLSIASRIWSGQLRPLGILQPRHFWHGRCCTTPSCRTCLTFPCLRKDSLFWRGPSPTTARWTTTSRTCVEAASCLALLPLGALACLSLTSLYRRLGSALRVLRYRSRPCWAQRSSAGSASVTRGALTARHLQTSAWWPLGSCFGFPTSSSRWRRASNVRNSTARSTTPNAILLRARPGFAWLRGRMRLLVALFTWIAPALTSRSFAPLARFADFASAPRRVALRACRTRRFFVACAERSLL